MKRFATLLCVSSLVLIATASDAVLAEPLALREETPTGGMFADQDGMDFKSVILKIKQKAKE